ncbi:GAF domain-containing protein [Argonema antarcticum]|uniref:GAF domain-containing protein n=1 Tax=Argonema antarcticum TaxID=2942763 RepID=UPI002011DA97|nr:GAF domain-containing protein [Argonema antarcticum]MCL1473666.1 GAF domain-containing protein [Argonema antarcticum A004/B2]
MSQQQKPNSDDKKLVSLGRVLQTLREEDNVDVLIETSLNYLQAEFDYSLIWIGFYDRLDHRILGKGGIAPGGDISFLKQRIFLGPGDLLEQVVIQLRPIGVPDLRQETRAGEWRKAAANFDIKGTLIFPIRYRDRCFGVVMLGSSIWGISPRSEEKARLSMLLGGFGASLNQIESDWNRSRTKRPDEPMFRMLGRLQENGTVLQKLEMVVAEVHQFVSPTRTSVYWFERERRYFWRRMSNRATGGGFSEGSAKASGITVQESGGFYDALVADRMVSIGEAQSSLKADVTSRLLQRLGVRSLLASPICLGDELLGFLAVEGNEPRIWKEEEKSFVRGTSQLIALFSPIERMEATIEQTKEDQFLTAQIATAVTTQEDWLHILKVCAERLTARLRVERCLVLVFNSDEKQFEVCYQSQPVNRRPLGVTPKGGEGERGSRGGSEGNFFLPVLSEVDWQLLERSAEAVGVEDLSTDLKFVVWRDGFLEGGVRSLLACNTSLKRPLTGLLIVTGENPRSWTAAQREIFSLVSQQVGLVLNQWRLLEQNDVQQRGYDSLQLALSSMQVAQSLSEMEGGALRSMLLMLEAPVAALVTWSGGSEDGRVVTEGATNSQFALDSDFVVRVRSDELIQEALATDGFFVKDVTTLSSLSRSWISGSGIKKVLVMALRTSVDYAPTGVAVVVAGSSGVWRSSVLPMFGLLVSQLAWFRRYMMLTVSLGDDRQKLQCLNWYKHRLIEDLYVKGSGVDKGSANALLSMPYARSSISDLLAKGLWNMGGDLLIQGDASPGKGDSSFSAARDSIRLTSLLLRSLDRIDDRIKQKGIWTQIHDAGGENALIGNFGIDVDILKVELVLYEVLMAACDRVKSGGRIDIWYRRLGRGNKSGIGRGLEEEYPMPDAQDPTGDSFIELSVTDDGVIDSQLIAELQELVPSDDLAPSTLAKPPGLHLRICQSILRRMGGDLNFYHIDDGRVLSRLLIPLS